MKKRHSTSQASVLNARNLRVQSTESEKKLWNALRNRRLAGLKFRRQYPVDRWMSDFYCLEKSFGIEVDGEVHSQPDVIQHDQARDEMLMRMGIHILHISV